MKVTIEGLKQLARQWTKEQIEKGKNPDEYISISYNKMIVSLIEGHLYAEKQLLELEDKLRKYEKASPRVKSKKRA